MIAQSHLQADWVSHILFESPGYAIVVLALVWMALRVTGRRTQNKRLAHLSWVALLLIGALIASATLVTTRNERLVQTLKAMLLSVEDLDFPAFRLIVDEQAEAYFPPEPAAQRFTRDQVEAKLSKSKVKDITLLSLKARTIDKDNAVTVIKVRGNGDYDGFGGVQIFEWAIVWEYENEQWRATRFECLQMGINTILKDDDTPAPPTP